MGGEQQRSGSLPSASWWILAVAASMAAAVAVGVRGEPAEFEKAGQGRQNPVPDPTLEIYYNGVKVFPPPAPAPDTTVSIGQQVGLSAHVVPANVRVTQWHWTYGTYAVGGYNTSDRLGQVLPVAAVAGDLTVYWWKPGTKTVTVTCSAGGHHLTGSVDFQVVAPQVRNYKGHTGTVGWDPNYWAGPALTTGSPGIWWEAPVLTRDFPGSFQFTQLVRRHDKALGTDNQWRHYYIPTGLADPQSPDQNWWLDKEGVGGQFALGANDAADLSNQNPPGQWGGSVLWDTPAAVTNANMKSVAVEFARYPQYLMFRPDGAGGIWVPLQKIFSSWQGSAEKVGGQWTGVDTPYPRQWIVANPVGGDAGEFPVWTGNQQDAHYQ